MDRIKIHTKAFLGGAAFLFGFSGAAFLARETGACGCAGMAAGATDLRPLLGGVFWVRKKGDIIQKLFLGIPGSVPTRTLLTLATSAFFSTAIGAALKCHFPVTFLPLEVEGSEACVALPLLLAAT